VLAGELRPARAQYAAQDEGDDDRVVELAGDRDEVRHEVERHAQVTDEEGDQQLAAGTSHIRCERLPPVAVLIAW
jgi:hypothetical protein